MGDPITEHMDIWTSAQVPKKTNGGRGRSSNGNGQGIYGIKKLRELILELAVRGKLVPQDPNDEPASVLLEKIAEEKKRLVKDGKIKKQKALPEIGDDEKLFELPGGWEFERFGNVTFNRDAERIPLSVDERKGRQGKYDYYGASGVIDKIDGYLFDKPLLLIGEDGANLINRSTPIAFIARGNYWVNNHAHVLDGISEGFLKYICLHINAISLEPYVTGTAQPKMNQAKMNSIVLVLPPLSEQRRIVAKVDELMSLCDQLEQQQIASNDTHQTLVDTLLTTLTSAADPKEFADTWQRIADHFDILFTTEQSIDQLKQTILQLAVMGKLVPQDPNDLPAPQAGKFFVYALECEDKSIYVGQTKDVLKRWKEHATGKGADWTRQHPPVRLVHWEEYSSREEASKREKELKTGFGRKWLKRELAAGRTRQAGEPAGVLLKKIAEEKKRLVKEGKIKKQKALPEIGDDEKIFELPMGWAWIRFGNIGVVIGGGTPNKSNLEFWNGDIPWVSPKDMKVDYISESSDRITDDAIEKSSVKLIPQNSLLIVVRGMILSHSFPAAINLVPVTINQDMKGVVISGLEMDFVLLMIKGMKNAFVEMVERSTHGTCKIVSNKLWNKVMAIPPFAEQQRIVAKIGELMTICDNLKARLDENQTTQVQLAEAIVEKSVAGQ